MRLLASCVIYACVFISVLPSRYCAAASSAQIANSTSMPMAQMPTVAPLFIEDGDFSSTLVLVNAASIPTYADVSVRSLYGQTVAMKRIGLQAHSQQQVMIRELLSSAHASGITAGSITVMQDPDLTGLVVTAVLSMTRMSTFPSNYINQELAMPTGDGSQTLRAVADAEEGSPIISITSLSEIPQHVQVRCLRTTGKSFNKTITLSANETLLTEACSNETLHGADFQRYAKKEPSEQSGPVGIELESDGMPGSYAAFSLIPHRSQDHPTFYSSAIFTDPATVKSTTTVFTGVPVGSTIMLPQGNYVPTLSLGNFSGRDSTVSIRYVRTVDNEAKSQDIQKVLIPAHNTREVSFPGLQGDPTLQDSFLIVADGAPGDIAAKLVARSDNDPREIEQLGKDLLDPQNGGNHPWSIEDGTQSTLLLFNSSASTQFFDVAITSAAVTWQKAYQLKTLQTKAININDLINMQTKDDHGVVLPKESWKGQVDWYLANLNTGRGRVLQSNRDKAMALDFSCGVNINLCQLQFSGTLLEISDGQTVDFGSINPYVCMNSCSGTPAGAGCTGCTYGWDSEAPTIASISGSSSGQSVNVHGASPGSTYVDAFASGMGCYVQVSPSPPVTVQIPTNTRVVQTAVNQLNSSCPSGYSGWDREVYRAVIDQSGADIKQSGQALAESVSITANGLNLGPFNTSPATTDSNGQFYDTFKACSALCPASSNTTTASQTITDTFNGVYTLTPTTLLFACGSVAINGRLTP